METKLTPFLFEGEAMVRVMERDGVPGFVGRDVASILGYQDTAKAVSVHCKRAVPAYEWWGVGDSPTLAASGRCETHPLPLDPQTKIIPEGDVFRLIFRSKLPAAQRFEAWVMEEVLPAIRRTGQYVPQGEIVQPAASSSTDRPWRERPTEERNTDLRTIAHVGRYGNHALAFWYMKEVVKIADFPTHLLSPWQQALDFGPPTTNVTVIVPNGRH